MSVTGVRLRLMQMVDLPVVMEIQCQAYGEGYHESVEVLGAKLALAPEGCWVAERNGVAVAYVFSHPWHDLAPPPLHTPLRAVPSDAQCMFLHDLAVAPAARSGGVAVRLFEQVKAWAASQGLARIALVALASAAEFWVRQGFAPVQQIAEGVPGYGIGARFMQRNV